VKRWLAGWSFDGLVAAIYGVFLLGVLVGIAIGRLVYG